MVGESASCAPPSAAGGPCGGRNDCAPDLDCDLTAFACVAVTWAGAGQPCGGTTRCLVGACPAPGSGAPSVCPTVIPDGQPCSPDDATSTCDTLANCVNGACLLGYPSCG